MTVVLNVKVGQRITFRDAAGAEIDAEVVELPKILRVKTDDGLEREIRAEAVVVGDKSAGGRFQSRLQSRL